MKFKFNMPNHFFQRKQQKYLLNKAKQDQAVISCVSSTSMPNYTSTAGVMLGCLLLLASVTATPVNARSIISNRRNPLQSDDMCLMPVKINPTNTLTIYHAKQHFFAEFICNYCNDGKFYADRHSIQPEGRERMFERNKFTNTVRDEYFNEDHEKLSHIKLHLSDKQAVDVMAHIRAMHAKLEKREVTFELFNYNCIDYTQSLYAATGAKGYFAEQFGTENLYSLAGAIAYYKHHAFSYDTIFKMMYILFHEPENALLPEEFKQSTQPCLIYDVNRTKPYYYQYHSYFKPSLAYCTSTPTGEQVLRDYTSPLTPDCEVHRGKCAYPKGHVPDYTSKERLMMRIEPVLKFLYG